MPWNFHIRVKAENIPDARKKFNKALKHEYPSVTRGQVAITSIRTPTKQFPNEYTINFRGRKRPTKKRT